MRQRGLVASTGGDVLLQSVPFLGRLQSLGTAPSAGSIWLRHVLRPHVIAQKEVERRARIKRIYLINVVPGAGVEPA